MICNPTNHTTHVHAELKVRNWEHYFLVQKVGRIPLDKITNRYAPFHFAENLKHQLNQNVFDPQVEGYAMHILSFTTVYTNTRSVSDRTIT